MPGYAVRHHVSVVAVITYLASDQRPAIITMLVEYHPMTVTTLEDKGRILGGCSGRFHPHFG